MRMKQQNFAIGFFTLSAALLSTHPAAYAARRVANVQPRITLASPLAGSTHTKGEGVILQATANDPDGSVRRVDFYSNGKRIGYDQSGPVYEITTSGLPIGTLKIRAKVTDNRGATTNSTTVSIKVVAAQPNPTPTPTPTPAPTPSPSPTAGCPADAIQVAVGASVQNAVNAAATNASFCLRAGVHRLQSIVPKSGQKFYGEPGAVLSGARLLTAFVREGSYWVATGQTQQGIVRGECTLAGCQYPEGLFLNDQPLTQVMSKAAVAAGKFYFDYSADKIYFLDDPTRKKAEATATTFAFSGTAPNVLIKGLVVEKYSSPAQEGAIMGESASGWSVEGSEIRYNSGTGVAVGTNGRIVNNKIHHNGQMGATAGGNNILLEGNELAYNNIYGFNSAWEAGAVKVTESNGVTFRGNYSHHNDGPGLWCDENVYNALYENNIVEYNQDAGIFHEISYNAIIRNNTVSYNGLQNAGWVWGANIQIAASQDVEIYGNAVLTRAGGTGIIFIDQNRGPNKFGTPYKTINNYAHHNEMTFVGDGVAGGTSDSDPGDENYSIIEAGNNRFNYNVYRVKTAGSVDYEWGQATHNFSGFRSQGQEASGQQVLY